MDYIAMQRGVKVLWIAGMILSALVWAGIAMAQAQKERTLEEIKTEAIKRAENGMRSEEHTSELQSRSDLVCRLLLEKKNKSTPSSLGSIRYTASRAARSSAPV